MVDLMKILSTGAMIVGAKPVLEGMFEQFLTTITIAQAEEWVIQKKKLWDNLPPGWQVQLINYGHKMGDVKFVTAEWAVGCAQRSNKKLASLFMNWPEAMEWLKENADDLQQKFKEYTVKETDVGES